MKKRLNEKGFTLVEILVVIAIISILFVILLPQLDRTTQKTKMTQVRNDFRTFQIATKSYMMDSLGQDMTADKFNVNLDGVLQFVTPINANTYESKHKDPWGSFYRLTLENGKEKLIIRSSGLDETPDNEDDYLLAVYYHKGIIDICTKGFDTNNIALTSVKLKEGDICGADPV